jgi:hypothetical protein
VQTPTLSWGLLEEEDRGIAVKIPREEILDRCDQIVSADLNNLAEHKNLFLKQTGLTITSGMKLLVINAFLTVLAYGGDITEVEFKELLITYRKRLSE